MHMDTLPKMQMSVFLFQCHTSVADAFLSCLQQMSPVLTLGYFATDQMKQKQRFSATKYITIWVWF